MVPRPSGAPHGLTGKLLYPAGPGPGSGSFRRRPSGCGAGPAVVVRVFGFEDIQQAILRAEASALLSFLIRRRMRNPLRSVSCRCQICNFLPYYLPCCMECKRGPAMRILSVCPFGKLVNCDKTEEKSVRIFIPYERPFSLVF